MSLRGLLVFLAALPAAAAVVTFDFEAQSPTFISPPAGSRPGALTSLGITSSGLTLTITRESGIAFDLVSNTGNQAVKPAGWGTVSLDPFFNPGPTAFILNFSAPITSFSVESGDYGGDSDTLVVQAFSAADLGGSLVGSSSTPYGTSTFPTIITGSAGGGSILSVRLIGGSIDFQNSMFYDNITVDTAGGAGVPEPGSGLLVCGSLGGLALMRRHRRA